MSEREEHLDEKIGPAKVADGRSPLLYPLFAPVSELDGVGTTLLGALRKLTGRDQPRVKDLLFTVPRRFRDLQPVSDVSAFEEGQDVTLELLVLRHRPSPRGSRAPYRIETSCLETGVDLVFFKAHERYLRDVYPENGTVHVFGRLQRYRDRWQMAHPEPLPQTDADRARAARIYPSSQGLTQTRLRRLVEQALEHVPDLPEWLDEDLVQREELPPFHEALARLHGASQEGDPELARRRLVLDELVGMQLALRLVRSTRQGDRGRSHRAEGRLAAALLRELPFSPTDAQHRCVAEIREDLESDRSMMRLLMGDVGSGKTLVAFLAMLHVVEAGRQAVLMAPTEVLARQHARTLGGLAKAVGIEIGLLTGQERAAARDEIRAKLAAGELAIAVGTHALFQEGVDLADLGLAVIDEQHRFGVHQRLELLRKGEGADLLLMTATPIPRSLVLSHYGDVGHLETR